MDPEMTRGSIAAALMNQQGIPAPQQNAGPAPNAPTSLPPQGVVAPSGVLQVPNMPFSVMPAGGGSPYLGYADKQFEGAPSPLGASSPAAPSPAAAPPSVPSPAAAPPAPAVPSPAPAPFFGGGERGGGGMAAPPAPAPAPAPFFGGNSPAPSQPAPFNPDLLNPYGNAPTPPSSSAPYQKPSGELVVPDMPFTVMMPSALYGPYGKYGTAYDRGG